MARSAEWHARPELHRGPAAPPHGSLTWLAVSHDAGRTIALHLDMPATVDTVTTMCVLFVVGFAALSAVAAALWPRVAYRLAVAFEQPPRPDCPRCHRPFPRGWRGWVRLGAPCPTCPAWRRSWWVTGGCAAAATAALIWRMPASGAGQVTLLMMWLIVVQACTLLSLIDCAVRRLPTRLVGATGVVVGSGVCAAALLAHQPRWVLGALLGAGGLGGFYLLIALFMPSQVGMGDVRLAAVLGAALGAGGWPALLLGAALAYVIALPFALAQLRHHPAQRGPVPFGPFLAVGAIIAAAVTTG